MLTLSGGAVAADGPSTQATAAHPGVLLPAHVPATVLAHAKSGTHTNPTTTTHAKAGPAKPSREPGARGVGSTADSEALALAQAMQATGQSFVTAASFVTVPKNGTPDLVSSELAPALTAPGFPSDGSTFAVLSSGDANLAGTANTSGSSGVDDSCTDADCTDGDPNTKGANRATAHDVTILKIALTVPKGMNCLSFDYRFLSDEYPEYVGTQYNDALIAELDTNSWTAASSVITAPKNFAFDPSGKVISINAAGTTSMSAGLSTNTTYDGATPLLRASTPVTVGNHNLFLSIFDQGDHIYDSAAFVDNLNLWTAGTGQCGTGSIVNEPPADLSLTKSAAVDGTQITYTLHVANAGPNPAENVKVEDEIPAGLEIVSASPGCLAGAAMECALGTLENGAATDLTLVVNALDNAVYDNTAEVTSSTFDPLLQNNEASAQATVGTPPKPGDNADLALVKAGPTDANLGDTVEYDLTVTNNGPDDVTSGFQVVDELPGSMPPLYMMLDPDSWNGFDGCYFDEENVVTCYFLGGDGGYTLPASSSVTVKLFVYPTAAGSFENDASVVLQGNDPTPENDTSSTSTTITDAGVPTADVTIAKTVDKALAPAGATLTYTITVTNEGPGAVADTEVLDPTPYYASDVSVDDTLGQCTEPDPTFGGVDCHLALDPNEVDTITYKVTLASDVFAGATIWNRAYLYTSPTYFDPNPQIWNAAVPTKVGTGTPEVADLVVDVTSPDSVSVGSTVTTTLKVTNLGPNTVGNVGAFVNLLAPFEAGAVHTAVPSNCNDNSMTGGFECKLGSLAKGASKTLAVKWTAPPDVGSFDIGGDTWSEDANWLDLDFDNNVEMFTMDVTSATADLALTHVAAPDPVVNGGKVTYTLTTTNGGPNSAESVQLVDALPDGSVVASIKGATCSGDVVITCNLKTIDAGKAVVVTIVAALNVDVPPLDVEADATVASATDDPDLANNAANATTTVNPPNADLGLTHTVNTSTVLKGGKVVHKFQIRNYGPLPTTTAVMNVDLPIGVTFVSVTGAKCTGAPALTCALGKIPVKAVKTVQVTTTASVDVPPDTLDVTAVISSELEDLNSANDESLQTITVNPPYADLKVTVTTAPVGLVAKGGTATFKFAVKNDGPQASTHVTLSATLPADVTMPAKAPAGCTFSGHDMTCTILSIGKGATKTFSVATKAPTTSSTALTATASVASADVEDLDPADDEDDCTVTTKP